MPVIGISVKQLNRLLQQEIPLEKLTETVEKLGCDLEGVGQTVIYQCPNCSAYQEKLEHEEPPQRCTHCGHEAETPFSETTRDDVIRLDLLPARPDLFDAAGLARAIKGYLELETGLSKHQAQPEQIEVHVSPALEEKASFRPFIACAVVTLPAIDSATLRTLMKLQENLHWGIGRDRKLASIGIYDLDSLTPPISYGTIDPSGEQFFPLGMPEKKMTAQQILEEHPKGKGYAHLLEGLERYPLLVDSQGQVLSMPPIINSHETQVKEGTTRLFIDVTGITQRDVEKSLNTLVSSIIELGGTAQKVKLVFPNRTQVTPDLEPRTIEINLETARKWLGIDLRIPDFAHYVARMRLGFKGRFPRYRILYPAYRTDIKHEVDIFEDLAIAHGYENIVQELAPTMTVGQPRPEEKLSEMVRSIMLGLGFVETMSLMLTTQTDHFTKLRLAPEENHAVIANPKSAEHNTVRTHLFSGLLASLAKNRRKALPQQYFELGNVVLVSPNYQTYNHTIEERRIAFVMIDSQVGYADGRAVLDAVLYELGIEATYRPSDHPTFIPGRCAQIELSTGFAAILGEVHPEVLNNFHLAYPVVLGEITLSRVIDDSQQT